MLRFSSRFRARAIAPPAPSGLGALRAALRLLAVSCLCLAVTACATSRVDDAVTPASLRASGSGVAIMRLGAASTACNHVMVVVGVREGNGYRAARLLRVMHVRSLSESPVAEVELPAGEYFFLSYICQMGINSSKAVSDAADQPGLYRDAFAKFTLARGEIVNIGYLHYNASHHHRSLFGRPILQEIEITDWPLEELERFRRNRPRIFAQMTTRLMQRVRHEGPDAQQCARLAELERTGKVAALPAACRALRPAPRS